MERGAPLVTSSDPLVLRSDADGVATLTLNRPDKLNALNPALFVELRDHIDALSKQSDTVGCVVLTGSGRAFCAGNDLASIAARELPPSPMFQPETVDALEQLPQPVIGRINGHCMTGGLELALACDLIIAGESATFADTHGKWGLAPVWGMSVRLPERIGRSAAKELMFSGRRIDGREAARIGLADRCVPDAELDATVAALAGEIVANSWGTSRIDKQLLAASARMLRDEALAHERSAPYGFPDDMAERLSARG
jgi:enoyl-CoA hydratase/carnithine racemase